MECAVVEARYSQEVQLLSPEVSYASPPDHVTYWIDPKRKVVLQWRSGSYTETVMKFELNPALPDSEFQFTPPPGARVHRPY